MKSELELQATDAKSRRGDEMQHIPNSEHRNWQCDINPKTLVEKKRRRELPGDDKDNDDR